MSPTLERHCARPARYPSVPLSSPLILSDFETVLFSTTLSARVLVAPSERPGWAWLVSTVPAWSEHMPPALLLYAHRKQIETISRRYATRSAILVLARRLCLTQEVGWKPHKKGVWYYRTAGLRKFPSQESTSWHLMDSARTLLSETIFRHFRNGLVSHLLRTLLTARCSCLSTQ